MKPTKLSVSGREALLLGLPSWVLLLAVIAPLAVGAKTLFYRDVLSTHYPLKTAQAQLDAPALGAAFLDPFRGGGQPLLGNPNAVPIYPTNALYGVADPLWALNAHFWLHWLLAPLAGYWLGRAWRLTRPGAWACGVAWATGGYVMSLLNLYNMVPLAVLAPAAVAASLDFARSERPSRLASLSILVGLTFLGGDPASAAIVYLLAATAFFAELLSRSRVERDSAERSVPRAVGQAAVVVLFGLMLAAPVLVEMLRILPASYRGLRGYDAASVLAQSWHPMTLLDWWIPGFFGELDLSFWGGSLFGGNPPFFSSLFPGWIVVALALAAGFPSGHKPRARNLWAWGAVGAGVFVALGGHNPLLAWLAQHTDLGLLRYPAKAWLATALGLSLLAGLGFDRLWQRLGNARLVFGGALLGITAAAVLIRPLLAAGSSLARFATEVSGGRLVGLALDAEVVRWMNVSTVSLLTLALAAAVLLGLSRRSTRSGMQLGSEPLVLFVLLLLQTGSQLVLLSPLVAMDDAEPYRSVSPVVARMIEALEEESGEGIDVVHGGFDQQFGPTVGPRPRDPSLTTLSRSLFAQGYHGAGVAHGLRYPFVRSPEGLDSFYAVVFAKALMGLDDVGRLRLLEAAGVEFLLLARPLSPAAAARADEVAVAPDEGTRRTVRLYRLLHGAPEVSLVSGVRRAASMTEVRNTLLDPSFDPRRAVILPGDGPNVAPSLVKQHLEVRARRTECLSVETDVDLGTHLVVQRAWQPIWRADVDGEPTKIEIANGWQMAVAVPAGHHEIHLCMEDGRGRWPRAALFGLLPVLALLLVSNLGRPLQKPAATNSHSSGV